MRQSHRIRRVGVRAAAGVLAASAAVVGFALPAAAATVPAQNHLIIEGGSNTTYLMMNQLAILFNQSPGCDLAAPSGSTQNLNYGCPNPQNSTGGENGLGDGQGYTNTGSIAQGDPENPYNDVVVEEPPLGSSNGIKELEQRGSNPSFIDLARSSRSANNGANLPTGDPVATTASDPEGLNFVAYAEDAVPWLHWTKVNGTKTPSAKIKSLSVSQLAAIYNHSDTNWNQVGGSNGPIDVYMAQAGSGTEGTWKQVLGLTSDTPAGVTDPATHVIFENEIHGVLLNGDEANAIFYFSYGKFQNLCVAATAKAKTAACGSDVSPPKSTMVLGSESISGSPIAPSQGTIQDGSFPTDRYLYNVYSDGSNSSIPASDQAALNFGGETGFICKEDSAIDSNTGATYGSEIASIIKAQGFFPFGLGTYDAGNIANFATITDPGYAFVDPLSQSSTKTTDKDYCRVFTTDGDGIS
jgi:ABC-type phosphate transport system substrate-binding protein